jgi:hypothetical protein
VVMINLVKSFMVRLHCSDLTKERSLACEICEEAVKGNSIIYDESYPLFNDVYLSN